MRLIAMDQSTKKSGYAIFDDGQYVASGVLDLSKSKDDTDTRSFEMAKMIWNIIDIYKPNEMVIENVQQQTSPKTLIILARLAGMILGYAKAQNIETTILLPTEWRRVLGYTQGPKVKREKLKQQSIDYIKERFGIERSEDECEALAIGCAYLKLQDDNNEN